MAKHTFVTASHTTYDETKTVEILTKAEVRKLVAEVIGLESSDIESKLKTQDRKLAKAAEQAAIATKDAIEARKEVARLIETMRETFHNVIEELLEPHYRSLAEHLGVELPVKLAKQKTTAKKQSTTSKETATATGGKKTLTTKAKLKGVRPCPKK